MRKQDIKPGVVYAYREGKYGHTLPVMFLSTGLYTGRGYRDTESPKFRVAGGYEQPHTGRLGAPTTGYLVAIGRSQIGVHKINYDEVADRMARITLADAEASAWELADGDIGVMLIVRLGVIIGLWDEVMAAEREQKEVERQRRERKAAEAKALDDRAAAVRKAITLHGISARFSSVDRNLIVSLDDAEKLAALLLDRKD